MEFETTRAAQQERNAACSCGSGKKFKRCCGRDSGSAVLPAWGKSESNRAIALLLQMIQSPMFEDAYAAAQAEWFGTALDDATKEQIQAALEHEHTQIAFNTWLLFDAYITNDRHRLMESVLDPAGPFRKQWSPGQQRFLQRMAASAMRPYAIREVRYDEGFTLKDLWSGEEIVVNERLATHSLQRGEMMFARLIEGPRGAMEIHGAVLVLEPFETQELLDHLRASFRAKSRRRPDLDETGFFKEAGPKIGQAWLARFCWKMPQLRTSDGEVLRSQDLIYDVLDRDALERALRAELEFELDEDFPQWIWHGEGKGMMAGGNVILGSLTPEGSRLRVHVMSDERAKRMREILGRIAPQALRYRLSELHDLSVNALRQGAEDRKTAPLRDPEMPAELEAKILHEFFMRQYTAWLDEPIPALGGRTPRHAAMLKSQRAKVAALIQQIESRPLNEDVPNPDTSFLWRELGLEDLRL